MRVVQGARSDSSGDRLYERVVSVIGFERRCDRVGLIDRSLRHALRSELRRTIRNIDRDRTQRRARAALRRDISGQQT